MSSRTRSKARANDGRNPPMVGGFLAIIAAESLEKKKAAKELAATTKAAKELVATERKKKEPTKSSKKTSNDSGSPLRDKSNEHHDSNVYPSKKGTTTEAEMGTKLHSVIHNDCKIAKLIRELKQTAKELEAAKEKDETIIKLEQELVEQHRKNDKLTAALKQANTTVKDREAIIIKLEQESAATQQRHAHPSTPSRSLWGRNGDTSNIPLISSTPSFVPIPIKSLGEDGWKPVGKFIKLEIAPFRTLSTEDGDPSRASLGNGFLLFDENLTHVDDIDVRTGAIRSREPGTVRRVNYYNTNHDLMFRAELPKRKLLKDIQGNAGADIMFAWDVVNEIHGFHRRYVFAFPSKSLLSVALYRIFYDNQQLMEEFFDVNGRNRFYAKEANVPAHKVVTEEYSQAMDIDRPRTHRPGYTSKQYQMELGIQYNVFDETQRY